jgi:hypothetical protein
MHTILNGANIGGTSDSELTPRPESDALEAHPWSQTPPSSDQPYFLSNGDTKSVKSSSIASKAEVEQSSNPKFTYLLAETPVVSQNISSGSLPSPTSPSPSASSVLPRLSEYGSLPGAVRSTFSVATSSSAHTTPGTKLAGTHLRGSAAFAPSYAPSADPNTPRPLVLNKFVLYENKRRLYVVATGASDSRYRMLRIDRTSPEELIVTEDEAVYTERQIGEILRMLEDGNKVSGGLNKVQEFHGIVGEQLWHSCLNRSDSATHAPLRIRSFYRWLVYCSHHQTIRSCPDGWPLHLSLRGHLYLQDLPNNEG